VIPLLFAQLAGGLRAWSFGELLIAIVIVAACVALVYVALRQFGVGIPAWVVQVAWIVVVAFVVILAIRLVLSF
jgi:hypothetical protein